LCIDNLEAISSENVRDFLANIPNGSKVLITTRVGLGEIEYRYKLDKLDDKSCVVLIRNLAKLVNYEVLYKKKSIALENIAKQLFNNPLLIKWYVLSVSSGKGQSEILNKSGATFKEAIRFCFENLYDRLGEVESKIISIIAAFRKPISSVQLRFFLENLEEIEITDALNTLRNSSMLRAMQDKDHEQSEFVLTDVAEEYLNVCRPVSQDIYKFVKDKKKELQKIIELQSVRRNHYELDINIIHWENKDQQICSLYISRSLEKAKEEKYIEAETYIEKAKSIMHDFSEIYRINGKILAVRSPYIAEREFEKAIEYNSNSVIAFYNFALFLKDEEEFPRALGYVDKAIHIAGDVVALYALKAFLLMVQGEYPQAGEIYDDLVNSRDIKLKKLRISTHDQAANCYRRWAEQSISDRDLPQSKKCLIRAIEIIDESFLSGDIDHGLVRRLIIVLRESDRYYKVSQDLADSEPTDLVFSVIDRVIGSLNVKCSNALRLELNDYKSFVLGEYVSKVDELIGFLDDSTHVELGRVLGTLLKIHTKDNSSFGNYGFIEIEDGQSLFFLPSEFKSEEQLSVNHEGVDVDCIVQQSSKGPVAIDVKPR
jgi:LuxR family glucitol operon transcriptional activator